MTQKTMLMRELDDLEAEYRYWLVESIRMERGIDSLEEEIHQHSHELGPERVADFCRRLDRTREQHHDIEAKIRNVRLRLDDLRTRLRGLPDM